MIYSSEAQFLIVQLKAASEAEGIAINNQLTAMKSGVRDHATLKQLSTAMELSHSAKMKIFEQLHAFRLDK